MTKEQAKKVGSDQALKSVLMGILIAEIIMAGLSWGKGFWHAIFWFTRESYFINIVIGVVLMVIVGHLFGQMAGVEILIKNRGPKFVGVKYGFATLITTVFLASWTGFFQEGLDNVGTEDNPFFDYIYKPVFWVTFFGSLPVVFVGLWFGHQIRRRKFRID